MQLLNKFNKISELAKDSAIKWQHADFKKQYVAHCFNSVIHENQSIRHKSDRDPKPFQL